MEHRIIPRTIHYCWFSGDAKPVVMQECIKSWQRIMPDYEIKCWDASTLDLSIPYLKEAYEHRNWAFITDYMRFYILWKEGGLYLDSDVEVYKRFDNFLSNEVFSGIEYDEEAFMKNKDRLIDKKGNLLIPYSGNKSFGVAIEAAIIGAVKGHPYIKACMDSYLNLNYAHADGTVFCKECPVVMAELAIPFGFIYKNSLQTLKSDIRLYPYPTFIYGEGYEEQGAYARHWRNGSWRDKNQRSRIYKWLNRFHLGGLYLKMERSPRLYRLYRSLSHFINRQ